jgi:hypothetical protein
MAGRWLWYRAIRLPDSARGQIITGIALGLVVETWLANLLSLVLPAIPQFWIAAGLTLLHRLALFLGRPATDWFNIAFPWGQLICLGLLCIFSRPYRADWLSMMITLIFRLFR